jgi:hypothetical protein
MVEQLTRILKLLESANVQKRLDALKTISQILRSQPRIAESAIPQVSKRLTDPSSEVRKEAVVIIKHAASIDSNYVKPAVSQLLKTIEDPNFTVRTHAIDVVCNLMKKDLSMVPKVLPKLMSAFNKSISYGFNPPFKTYLPYSTILATLAEIGLHKPALLKDSVPSISRCLRYPVYQSKVPVKDLDKLYANAARALGVIGKRIPDHVKDAIPLLSKCVIDTHTLPYWRKVKATDQTALPWCATYALDQIAETRLEYVMPFYIDCIVSSTDTIRRYGLRAINDAVRKNRKNAIRNMLKYYKSPEPKIAGRITAIFDTIGKDPKNIVPILIDALADPDATISSAASEALIKFESRYPDYVIPFIVELLTSPDTRIREYASIILGRVAEAPEMICERLGDILRGVPKRDVRKYTITALGTIGGEHPPAVKSQLPLIVNALTDTDKDVRLAALTALYNIGSKSADIIVGASTNILTCLTDTELEVVKTTIRLTRILGGVSAEVARSTVAQLIATYESHKEPEIRLEVTKTLCEIGKSNLDYIRDATSLIIESMDELDAQGRLLATETIKSLGVKLSDYQAVAKMLLDYDTKLEKIKREGVKITKADELLKRAREALKRNEYMNAMMHAKHALSEAERVETQYRKAYELMRAIPQKIDEIASEGADVSIAREYIEKAKSALANNEYAVAIEYANQSKIEAERVELQHRSASNIVKSASELINNLKREGIIVSKAEDLLRLAEYALKHKNYADALSYGRDCKEVAEKTQKLYRQIAKELSATSVLIDDTKRAGINVALAEDSLRQARKFLERGDYDSAVQYLDECKDAVETARADYEATSQKIASAVDAIAELETICKVPDAIKNLILHAEDALNRGSYAESADYATECKQEVKKAREKYENAKNIRAKLEVALADARKFGHELGVRIDLDKAERLYDELVELFESGEYDKLATYKTSIEGAIADAKTAVTTVVSPPSAPPMVTAIPSAKPPPPTPLAAKTVDLEPGFSYLILERTPERCFEQFKKLTAKLPGLCISTSFPKKLRRQYGLRDDIPLQWLTDTSDYEDALNPRRLEFEITEVIGNFVRKQEGGSVVILDGLEHLVLVNGFEKVADFLKSIVDMIAMYDSTFIIPVSPGALSEREMAILSKRFDKVEDFT